VPLLPLAGSLRTFSLLPRGACFPLPSRDRYAHSPSFLAGLASLSPRGRGWRGMSAAKAEPGEGASVHCRGMPPHPARPLPWARHLLPPGEKGKSVRSPHEAKRNAGFTRTGDDDPDCAALHPGYACSLASPRRRGEAGALFSRRVRGDGTVGECVCPSSGSPLPRRASFSPHAGRRGNSRTRGEKSQPSAFSRRKKRPRFCAAGLPRTKMRGRAERRGRKTPQPCVQLSKAHRQNSPQDLPVRSGVPRAVFVGLLRMPPGGLTVDIHR
jgi:hypothetical protein